MKHDLEALADAATRAFNDLDEHEARHGTDPDLMPAGQRERRDRLMSAARRASDALADAEAAEATRAEQLAVIREAVAAGRVEPATPLAPVTRTRTDPWASGSGDDLFRVDSPTGLRTRALDAAAYAPDLPSAARAKLTAVIEQDDDPRASAFVIAATDPAYRSAFESVLRDPARGHLLWSPAEREAYARVEAARTSLSLTDANGGYLVPLTLDPTVILTNTGAASPWRQLATIRTTATNTFNGVQSAGVTAEWLAEGATASDANPTFDRLTVTVHKAAAYLNGSYEIFADTDLTAQLPALIADAKNNHEAAAFATGSGSGAPYGLLTALSAVTGSVITATTRGSIGIPDLYLLQESVPPRARFGSSPAVVASLPILNTVRQLDAAAGASLWQTLGDGTPSRLLGMSVAEASTMATTTTSGSYSMIMGDLSKYLIVDRLGVTLVPIPAEIDQATGRPNGKAGWFAYWRVGADVADAGAFRLLKC